WAFSALASTSRNPSRSFGSVTPRSARLMSFASSHAGCLPTRCVACSTVSDMLPILLLLAHPPGHAPRQYQQMTVHVGTDRRVARQARAQSLLIAVPRSRFLTMATNCPRARAALHGRRCRLLFR